MKQLRTTFYLMLFLDFYFILDSNLFKNLKQANKTDKTNYYFLIKKCIFKGNNVTNGHNKH